MKDKNWKHPVRWSWRFYSPSGHSSYCSQKPPIQLQKAFLPSWHQAVLRPTSHFLHIHLQHSLPPVSPPPRCQRDAGAAGETHGGATARLIKTCGGRSEILREFPPCCSSHHYQRMLQQESSEQMLQIWSQTKTFPSFEDTFSPLGIHLPFIPPPQLHLLYDFDLLIWCDSLHCALTRLGLSRQIGRPPLKGINRQIPKFAITHTKSACGQSEGMWLNAFNLYPTNNKRTSALATRLSPMLAGRKSDLSAASTGN